MRPCVFSQTKFGSALLTLVSLLLTASLPFPLLESPVLAQSTGLVAAYSFNEGAGSTVADLSGYGNPGTIYQATWTTTAKYGNALNFDGSNDRVNINDSASLDLTTGMTLEAWVRPNSTSGWRTVILKEVPGELAYALYSRDSDHSQWPSGWVRFTTTVGGSHFTEGNATLANNTWSHLAATFDGTNLKFFLNGVEIRSRPYPGSIQTSSSPLRIGGNAVWGEYFRGQIDEVRIYNRALTAAEITADMNTPLGAPDTIPPTVSLTAPADGATVSGTINVNATASDNVAVAGVQFLLDGGNLGTEDTVSPYSVSWNTTTVSNGSHTLTARARDAAGNTSTSTVVNVTVSNVAPDTTPPMVSVTNPTGGATVTGTVSVDATASDNVGVAGVQFLLNGVNLGTEDMMSPYSVSWNTTTASNGSHTLTARARDAAGNVTTSVTVTVTVSNGGGGTPLTIDGSQIFQTINGFGTSINSASWDAGEARPAIDLLSDMGVSIWRVVIDNADWEATNDNADPNIFNWTYYNSVYTNAKFEELWSTIAYLNQKGFVGENIVLNFMGPGPAWMGGSNLNASAEDEWVEMVASAAYYARNTRNLQFGIFAPNNEPDWDGIEGIHVDQWQWVRVMGKLAVKLDAIGLADLRLLGADTASIFTGINDYMPEMLANAALMNKLDHFAFHNYGGDTYNADSVIKNSAYPNKNFWITEYNSIATAMAHLRQGPTALLVWDGYDSVYNHGILAGRGTTPPNDSDNAFLSYNTSTRTYAPRKVFYEHKQLFKYVPAGSRRIAASESNGGVTVYAFHDAASGRVTIVGRNGGSSSVNFSATLANLPPVPVLEYYYTDLSANFQRGSDIPVTNNAFSFTAPAWSVFTLTFSGTPDTTPPTVSVTAPAEGSTVSATVNVDATASDNVGVAGVQFKLDGVNLGSEDASAPYSMSWNTGTATNGTHQLTVVARDAAGNVTTSTAVNVTVSNAAPDTTPPTVSLTNPANGATVSGTTSVSADALDNVSVAGVQFKLDGVNLGTEDTAAPYSVSWNTTTASNGSHTLSAMARDAAGNTATSSVTVTAANTQPTGTVIVDPSSPTRVTGSTSVTTASFDPPNNSLLLVMISSDGWPAGIDPTVVITNNGTSLPWTLIRERSIADAGAEEGEAGAFYALLPTGRTGMTVTATLSNLAVTISMKVYVITGHNTASPIGASGEGSSTTNDIAPSLYTSTVSNSLGFGVANDWNASGLPNSLDEENAFHVGGSISGLSAYKATSTPTVGTSVTMNFDGGGTGATKWNWVGFEVKPAP